MVWAATRRGWTETSVLVGDFVEASAESLEGQDLADLSRLLLCDDWFLTALATGRRAPPGELDTPVLRRLRKHVARLCA